VFVAPLKEHPNIFKFSAMERPMLVCSSRWPEGPSPGRWL